MQTTAIYTVCQHGQETQFYSYCAGGYSYPFHVADWLSRADFDLNRHRMEDDKLSVSALLPQMTGDYQFPEAAKGLHLFRSITESAAANFLGRTDLDEKIPFHITLDLDRQTVAFVFNRSCPELDLPDLELPMQGSYHEMNGSKLKEATNYAAFEIPVYESPFVAEMNEKIYEQHIRAYAESQLAQGGMGMTMG